MTTYKELEDTHGPMWSDADQAHFIASFKKDLAEILTNNDYSLYKAGGVHLGPDGEILLICVDTLRGLLIEWCRATRRDCICGGI
jgi:hypothetical protein